MTSRTTRTMLALWLAAPIFLAGCDRPQGPVLGEWQGEPPGSNADATMAVDLVLYGAPGATSGRYVSKMTLLNPNQFSGHGTQEWSGPWTSRQGLVDGQAATFITLHDHLPDQIGGYARTVDGNLHALDSSGAYDRTPAGALYTLAPVRSR